jgi:hypothetical protein
MKKIQSAGTAREMKASKSHRRIPFEIDLTNATVSTIAPHANTIPQLKRKGDNQGAAVFKNV